MACFLVQILLNGVAARSSNGGQKNFLRHDSIDPERFRTQVSVEPDLVIDPLCGLHTDAGKDDCNSHYKDCIWIGTDENGFCVEKDGKEHTDYMKPATVPHSDTSSLRSGHGFFGHAGIWWGAGPSSSVVGQSTTDHSNYHPNGSASQGNGGFMSAFPGGKQ